MNAQEKLDSVVGLVKQFDPNFRLIQKSQSRLHRAIGWLLSLIGNKAYMSSFWTTIGSTVARPTTTDQDPYDGEWKVILHEGRHALDSKRFVFLFQFLYGLPQIVGVLALLTSAITVPCVIFGGAPAWLLSSTFFALLAMAWPAPFRAWFEARAFVVSMAVQYWSDGIVDEDMYINELVSHFVGSDYYYMFPFRDFVRKYFEKKLAQIKDNTLELDAYLAACKVVAKSVK